MDNHYVLRRTVRFSFFAVMVMVVTVLTVSCNNERRPRAALETLCCDSRIGPFEFRQERLKDIIKTMTAESREEWHRCGMHDSIEIESSGSEEWLNQVLSSSRIEESPILVAFHRLEEISNSTVKYSDGIISIQERIITKEDEEKRFKQFRNTLSYVTINGSIHHDVSFTDLLQRLYEEANVQLSKGGHPSMGLACNTITNVYFTSISIPSGSIYGVFENVADRIGAKVEYCAGNIIVTQTNHVKQATAGDE